MRDQLEHWYRLAAVESEERWLAGVCSGVMYLTGAATLILILVLPGVERAHWRVAAGLAAVAATWGLISARAIDWRTAPPWLIHASNTAGFVLIAGAVAATGGATSPAWIYLYFIVVFASYFYAAPVALAYLGGCAIAYLMPLTYDSRAVDGMFLGQAAIAIPSYFLLGGAILMGKHLLAQLRDRAELLAAEQGALRSIATAAAAGADAEETYALVAEAVARLLHASAAGILRFESDLQALVMGSWSTHPNGRYEPGTIVPVRPGSDVEQALLTGHPVRVDRHEPESPVDRLGYACSVVAPVHVGGGVWGILAVVDEQPAGLETGIEQRLVAFGDLLATAISSTEDRAKLAARASTDPLTGLANHRSFHDRLVTEVRRASRHGSAMSVAVIDVDHFKQVNDLGGHELGDRVLVELADLLAGLCRAEDVLARIGGDEFAMLLPESDRLQTYGALERARRVVAAEPLAGAAITISVGVCDTDTAEDPIELLNFADGALYWSKAHGRNACWIYDPEVVRELSAHERAEHLQRSQALVGLRALARAIDAKDQLTRRHSERVAELAAKLATTVGWPEERVRLLSEAALVHDVGKIGVPDAVLLKDGPLTPDEYEQVKQHAELGAQIVDDVLTPEQVEWVRSHHERPDGRGYMRGLTAAEIPEGAALLAIADAWDVMTLSRPYGVTKSVETAIEEVIGLVERQFTTAAVEALVSLHAVGELAYELTVASSPTSAAAG